MFKKRTRPQSVRKAKTEDDVVASEASSGAATPTEEGQSVQEMMVLRKLRRAEKQAGIDLERFNRGEEKAPKAPEIEYDKFGLHPSVPDGEDETARAARKVMTNNFTQQTNALDTDKHMMAYIDKEMAKRKGIEETEEKVETDREGALYAIADQYMGDKGVTEAEEGTMKNSLGMLSAVPEVDLGMENRLRNIEETEKAKRALLGRKKEAPVDDPLANVRFARNTQPRESDIQREMDNVRREAQGLPARHKKERPQGAESATDEAVYERFKKRARR
ncbi:hypothetical protein CcaverHIS002_0111830 [Cutaneotrichosporon cavernicola]|uniref:Hepatocellular carcinoma-associated antigen 59-domain-containing protein n=1 Tax=Cutaneotrichosporon cavernicola TaxID=279322 RepID=A0AA48I7E5_9TREE|nr:uncharacterized protein CcaverHIS019_0111730 [Cutaneotrichosporon cavernicola]BEI80654.1 hypothetical protein CcaverHIS002_0111830 [Cutaneotrichosporon cavernicola]BEI88455.1 hypothetical protein CcaverHIS019_0111730 [Cutaneotrichosporon cavernicola]BEI96228.1 hypothetical protein CcaverHIS631_0111770 [Cutaneotrichosporon cavernicola]BEJ03999.1 hypothetical protein CcaverHIS641_0111740 [Cutaneotrichosporon cavernicola]